MKGWAAARKRSFASGLRPCLLRSEHRHLPSYLEDRGRRIQVDCEEAGDRDPALTILAGANSSGKSSMMQAVLLLKQTLESPSDPGSLLIRGPNIEFYEVKQMFFNSGSDSKNPVIEIEIHVEGTELRLKFSGQKRRGQGPLDLVAQTESTEHGEITLDQRLSSEDLITQFHNNTYWKPIIAKLGIDQGHVTSTPLLPGGDPESARRRVRDEARCSLCARPAVRELAWKRSFTCLAYVAILTGRTL